VLHRPRSSAKASMSRLMRLRSPSHAASPKARAFASSTSPPTTSVRPTSRSNRPASAFPSSQRHLHGPVRSSRKRPPSVLCEAPAPFCPFLMFLGVTSRFPERLLGRPIPNAPRSGAAGQARSSSHQSPRGHRGFLLFFGQHQGSTLPPPAGNPSRPGLGAVQVRPNPSLQRTRYARR